MCKLQVGGTSCDETCCKGLENHVPGGNNSLHMVMKLVFHSFGKESLEVDELVYGTGQPKSALKPEVA